MSESEIFAPFEKLVSMGILGKEARVPENNVLLRGLVNGLLNIVPLYFLVDCGFIFREDRRCVHDMIAGTVVVVGHPGEAPPAAPAAPAA